LIAGNIRGSLEIHVLDPVGHARPSRTFVARSDAVPAPDRDERCGVHCMSDDSETVRKHGASRQCSWQKLRGDHLAIILRQKIPTGGSTSRN
jgi:hypothetical protein